MGSGFKTFTAASVLTAADLNNYCQTQSVMYFASTTARDAAITAPVAGMVAFIDSNDANEGLYVYHGATGGWRKGPGWNAPWGAMGLHKLASANATAATHTTLQANGLTTTFNAVSNRNYKLTMVSHPQANGGANNYTCNIYVNGVSAAGLLCMSVNAAYPTTVVLTGYYTTAATASMTVAGYHAAFATNTQVTDNGGANLVRFLMVEDIGPSGAPV
jgi:hypothetical protein